MGEISADALYDATNDSHEMQRFSNPGSLRPATFARCATAQNISKPHEICRRKFGKITHNQARF